MIGLPSINWQEAKKKKYDKIIRTTIALEQKSLSDYL
jgi:hypothetical protein